MSTEYFAETLIADQHRRYLAEAAQERLGRQVRDARAAKHEARRARRWSLRPRHAHAA
ncbi:hypothetical protein EV193_102807 [Herbihabitans rhizosphaerae]|uniref:Uncharacterized protein n=1 Tax=Herbihabitans rhizosphaerae TaxID=1872711 RepID=A0A4Q7L3U2_9PSEU|nr:hypothetical protein [Herbihabitans rhizosphaerae]RZS43826.1 hypothetical protein EV193_102807 [Herbihabitans rhizosphaerae]